MKLVLYELYKLFKNKFFAVVFVLIVLAGIVSGFFAVRSDIATDEFIKFTNDSVTDECNLSIALGYAVNNYEGEKPEIDPAIKAFGSYGEVEQYEKIISETVLQNLEQRKNLAITNSFTNKETESYIAGYNRVLQDFNNKAYIPFGVQTLTENPFADIAILAAVIIATLIIGFTDKITGMGVLVFSTKKGRLTTAVAKIAALMIVCAVTVITVSVSLLIIGDARFSLGELNHSIQSLPGFLYSTLKMTVGQYLILFVLGKLISMFLYGMIILTVIQCCKSAVFSVGIIAALASAEGVLFYNIPQESVYAPLSALNIASFYDTNYMISSFHCFNLFGIPMPMYRAFGISLLLLAVIFAAVYMAICSKKVSAAGNYGFIIKNLSQLQNIFRVNKSASLSLHETIKTFISNKALLILCAVAIIGVGYYSFLKVEYSFTDITYHDYVTKYGGEVTGDTMDFINREEQRYSIISNRLQALENSGQLGDEYSRLREMMKSYPGFDKFRQRAGFIYEHPDIDKSYNNAGMKLIYETGFNRLLSFESDSQNNIRSHHNILTAAVGMLLLMLLILPLYAADKASGMTAIIRTTPAGRRRLFTTRLVITVILAVLAFVLVYFPDFYFIAQNYDISGINVGARSLELLQYNQSLTGISIRKFLALIYISRLVLFIIAGAVMLIISYKSDNFIVAVIISALMFICPLGVAAVI